METPADHLLPDKPFGAMRPRGWLVALVGIVCFAGAVPNDYCYDAKPVVENNVLVTGPGQWGRIWTTDLWFASRDANPNRDLLYRPVALTSYRLVRALAGDEAWPQHLTNVLLHALVCVLVVSVGRRLCGSERGAMLAGLLFAVLPIHCDVVANMVGRSDLIAALGVLLAVICHWHGLDSRRPAGRFWWFAGAGAAAFAAMGAKESGVSVLPLVVLLHLAGAARADADRSRNRGGLAGTWRSLAYLVAPAVVYFTLRWFALGGQLFQEPGLTKTINVLVDAPGWQRMLGVVQLWGMYWAKTAAPVTLCIEYNINAVRLATGVIDWHVLTGMGVTALLIAVSVRQWRRGRRYPALLAAAIVLSYLPTANALVLIQVFFAERIWYLASVWVALLAASLVAPLLNRPATWAVCGLVLSGMAGRCWIRNLEWRDNGTLFAAAYRDHPDSVAAQLLFGRWLAQHGEPLRGIELMNRAVETDLGLTDAHRALGSVYLEIGQVALALDHLRTADMQVKDHPETTEMLERARNAATAGAPDDLQRLRAAADADTNDLEAELAYVRRLLEVQQQSLAISRLWEKDASMAAHAAWHRLFAEALLYAGELDPAIERYRKAVALAPKDAAVSAELAMLLIERRGAGDLDDAERLADAAARQQPVDPRTLVCLAELAALRGDIQTALTHYRRAIDLLPPNSTLHGTWTARARTLGE